MMRALFVIGVVIGVGFLAAHFLGGAVVLAFLVGAILGFVFATFAAAMPRDPRGI
jgi:hypothetical protein